MKNLSQSFCASGNFPYKALNNKRLLDMIIKKKFSPIHAIIIPTNACNLNCSFCCCSDRIRQDELSFDAILYILDKLVQLGTKSITLSGGGEPTIHPHFIDIILAARQKNMGIGLVTNGTNMQVLKQLPEDSIEWCRISFGDGRNCNDSTNILNSAKKLKDSHIIKTIGLSYVVTSNPDIFLINKLVNYVSSSTITYIKFIMDQTMKENDKYPQYIEDLQCEKKIISPIVYSSLNNIDCMLYLIKPVFAADGYVYPCCEVQYNNTQNCYPQSSRILTFEEYFLNIDYQRPIAISNCAKCYHATLVDYLRSTKEYYHHEDWL